MEVLAALQLEPEIDGNLALHCALLHDVVDVNITGASPT
jgi:HD superfamily phosphodiesterase